MNSGSYALEPISQDGVLVTIALVLAGVLAILTVIAMMWGARLKRKRRAAEAEEQHRIDDLKADGVEATNTAEGRSPVLDDPRPAPGPADRAAALPDEPIAAAAPLDASPASVAADAPLDHPTSTPDDPGAQPVTILKGLGPKIATRLEELGITRLDQLAWLDDAEAADLDRQLGAFEGRMERDRWREQARLLAKGDRATYEAQFGRLG